MRKFRRYLWPRLAVLVAILSVNVFGGPTTRPREDERLSFQAGGTWNPRVNVNADVAMAYGIDPSLPDRIKSWAEHGYVPHVMTGVAWGEYQDYLYGRFDGQNHEDEAQTTKPGVRISHGRDVYYMSPGEAYGRFLCVGIKRALDAGAQAIHLEEPEFWAGTGWEPNFRREWQAYYHEPWVSPDSSPDAQYRASKLKAYLYRRALKQVFDFVKQYGDEHGGRKIPCYVATHSLLNYTSWEIVSPESSLLDVGCDGFIAQVWTGTAREPNVLDGVRKQRTFETAFLEYGALQNLGRATGTKIWYLNDPIEDNPNHSWFDYRTNWESTLVASLLQPDVWRYEVMPWPHRVFQRRYPSTQPVTRDTRRIPMPAAYETELQAVISAMGDMRQPPERVRWEAAGTPGVGVLVSDTMMYQRFGPAKSDEQVGSFYGLALPLLSCGVPVEPVQIETAVLAPYKVLLLTYEGQKPPKPEFHAKLVDWVQAGGALVVVDNDRDPFHAVREWWNTGDNKFATPRHHLFDALGVGRNAAGITKVGKGVVVYADTSPARLSHKSSGGERVRDLVRQATDATGIAWRESPALVLRRGPYVIASGLDEFPASAESPVTLHGRFIPLFDAEMPVIHEFPVTPGVRAVLVDVDAALPGADAGVVAAACRVSEERVTDDSVTFRADGIEDTAAVVCVKLPAAPKGVTVDGQPVSAGKTGFDYSDGVLRVRFTNRADAVSVVIKR
jgi:hypothetical protein